MTRVTPEINGELLAAAIDAQATIRPWLAQPRQQRDRIRRHVAWSLNCYPSWVAIKVAIANRVMREAHEQTEPMRWVA